MRLLKLNIIKLFKQTIIQRWPVGPKLWVYFLILFSFFSLVYVCLNYFCSYFCSARILFVLFLIYFLALWLIINPLVINKGVFIIELDSEQRKIKKEISTIIYLFFYIKLYIGLILIIFYEYWPETIFKFVLVLLILILFFLLLAFYIFLTDNKQKYWFIHLWDYPSFNN